MEKTFRHDVFAIAVPAALQSLVQNSLTVIDQVMIGQLGVATIAAAGFAGKYISIFQTVLTAAASGLGIFAAQYAGRKAYQESSALCHRISCWSIVAVLFISALSCIFPVMRWYTQDAADLATAYLRIAIWSLPFHSFTIIYSVMLRCFGFPKEPFYASAIGIGANTLLNALFIFGWNLGMHGAALATVLSSFLMSAMVLYFTRKNLPWLFVKEHCDVNMNALLKVVLPLVLADFFWSLGENVYMMVYGHSTLAGSAAMTMTVPIQSLYMGLLMGFSQAAGILVGQDLGRKEDELALAHSHDLMKLSFWCSLLLFGLLACLAPLYVQIYSVDEQTASICVHLLLIFGLLSLVKVQNMVLGGGILRSGGHTGILLAVDLTGTWVFGVPLAFLGLYLFKTQITWIYLLLSSEEVIRYILCLIIFRRKNWMSSLQ